MFRFNIRYKKVNNNPCCYWIFGLIIKCFFHSFYALLVRNISAKCFYIQCNYDRVCWCIVDIFKFVYEMCGVFNVGWKSFCVGLEIVINEFGKFACMTINGTSYRPSWYIFLVYFRWCVEVRCFYICCFKLSSMFFAKTCWRWNVSIVSLTIFICSFVRSWLILL